MGTDPVWFIRQIHALEIFEFLKPHDLQLHGLERFYFNFSSSLWKIDTVFWLFEKAV